MPWLRIARSIVRFSHTRHNSTSWLRPIPQLPDAELGTFQTQAFEPQLPHLLPRNHFDSIPAITSWFHHDTSPSRLDESYLGRYASTLVPVELITPTSFTTTRMPLGTFLSLSTTPPSPSTPRLQAYVAQAPLSDLPSPLQADLPTPSLVLRAGRGDVYSTSVWLGAAPTYTPLHRDPNPNLFVQLGGRKRVRVFAPGVGREVFEIVRREVAGRGGQVGNAVFRGEEMMMGPEREGLERAVWEDQGEERPWLELGRETELGPGDGLFIPKGWWHSIKGVGEGMVGSVNWWFR